MDTVLDSRSWIMQADGSSWGWLDVIAGEQHPTSAKMIMLPPGVWTVSGVWQGNFDAEIRYHEAGGVVTLGGVISAQANDRPGFFALQLPLSKNASVHIRPRGTVPVGARATFTATLFPIFVGGVGFSGLLLSWWAGGHDDRATGLPTATDNYSETQCDYRSLLSGDRRAKQIREHNFRRSWGSLRSHRRTDVERKHQHSTSFSPCRGRAFSNRVHHDCRHGGTHGENRGGYTGRMDSDSRHRQHERFGYSQGGRDCHAGRLNLAAVKVVAHV